MTRPVLYYTDHHQVPLPAGHKFPMAKYRLLRERLAAGGLFDLKEAPPAAIEDIERVHDSIYVRGFLAGTLPAAVMRRIGFPWSEGLVARTLASAGSTLAASEHAIEFGFGGTLAGGTHHAFRGEGSGFCVFNDIAVAVVHLRENRGIERAAVVDLDVHQGDGTAQIFEHDAQVLTLSFHGRNNFPFRKQRGGIDVEFDDGTADEEYLARLEEVLPRVFDFRPGVVFYQSGVDALASDTLGRLALTHQGLRKRDRMVIAAARQHGAPFVVTLGGGYSNPIESTVEAHVNTFRELHSGYGPPSERQSPPG